MKKIALIILDGVGITAQREGNSLLYANAPFFKGLFSKYPKALLKSSAEDVGLPWGEFGNSEVCHTNIGLGRIVLQDLPQIDLSISNGELVKKPLIVNAKEIISQNRSTLHLIGIASDGNVHGKIHHLLFLAKEFGKTPGANKVILHLIADGRDVEEKSIERYLEKVKKVLSEKVVIGSIMGRYYAMDRDKNWDRIEQAYKAVTGKLKKAADLDSIIKSSYSQNVTDEFVVPARISDFNVDFKKDVFIFTNFRADRAIQLTRAFVDPQNEVKDRAGVAQNFLTITTYDDNIAAKAIFSNIDLSDKKTNPLSSPLVEILSKDGLRQFHVAETEKYAHVTYFFSGGRKENLPGQTNKLIPSNKLKTHDKFPQMRAAEISNEIIVASRDSYEFIVANYANGDMVGHSGNFEATIKAFEILDQNLKSAIQELLNNGYEVFLTADHGNCDEMIDLKSGKPDKEHSLNPVPFIFISAQSAGNFQTFERVLNSEPIGILADAAPTILSRFGISVAEEMTGENIINSLI